MRRILFVDDEQHVLDGLRDLLRRQRQQWEMVFALGGEAALQRLATMGPFDVVVTDMRMPGMDGAELLRTVKELYPSTARIVLSGQADQEMVLRALPVSHQYLSKPCQADTLLHIIERVCELRGLLPEPALQELVGDLETLPSAPASYWDLMRALDNPRAGIADVCRIVECDPALHAKVLQIANSAFFGAPQRVGSVSSAVNYLGVDLLKALAMSNQVFSAAMTIPELPDFSLETLQNNALLVADLAKQLVPQTNRAGEAFTAAFLRDVGKIVLALRARPRFAEALRLARESDRPLHVVELELLGASHAHVGAFLLGTWGLPSPIVAAVAHHHVLPEQAAKDPVALAVHVADRLVEAASPGPGAESSQREGLDALGPRETVQRWREIAEHTFRRRCRTDEKQRKDAPASRGVQ